MSGTDLAYGAISLRACYAMTGTDLGYGDTVLRACYAMSGTDLGYGAPSEASSVDMNQVSSPHCEIKDNLPPLQYSLYWKCVFLELISGNHLLLVCVPPYQCLPPPYKAHVLAWTKCTTFTPFHVQTTYPDMGQQYYTLWPVFHADSRPDMDQ
eukprot:2530558-Rhodomonas_salina.1